MLSLILFPALLLFMAGPTLPFAVQATENVSAEFPGAPQLEGASFAQWEGRWVFIGGRMAGYHATGGGSADFSRVDANRDVWVVDTTSKPARTYHVAIDTLPAALSLVKDEWMSTGQLSYQDGAALYIAGGYGQDSAGQWITYPLLTKVDVPALVQGVMRGKLPGDRISFVESTLVQAAGGDLVKLSDNNFYLVMGHVFTGSYTAFEGSGEHNRSQVSQSYLNEIRKLKISSDESGPLSVSLIEKFHNEAEFHRRDLNVAKVLSATGLGLAAYGGVFTPDTQLSYSKPIYLRPNGAPSMDQDFEQKMNAYQCGKLLLFDRALQSMYTVFLGGISRFLWDPAKSQFIENARIGNKNSGNYLDGLQWSDQISVVKRVSAGSQSETTEYVETDLLPGYVGTNALFIPLATSPRVKEDPSILDIAALPPGKNFVGYLYGGIRAYPFQFPYTKTSAPYNAGTVPTKPSDLILKVYVDRHGAR